MKTRWGKVPIWFKLLNLLFLLPVIFWPIVLFGSVFMFDKPSNFFLTFLLFLLINGYPFFFVFLMYLNSRLFEKIKLPAILLPLVFSLVFFNLSSKYLGGYEGVYKIVKEIYLDRPAIQEPKNREILGFGYTKDSLNIFFADSLLKSADVESFEVIIYLWAKDEKLIYRRGQPIRKIDPSSFEYLKNGYLKDKNHIYYDTFIISGADIETFTIPWGDSDYASDSLNCYLKEKRINCNEMPEDTTYVIQSR